jgi:hypothetical protein
VAIKAYGNRRNIDLGLYRECVLGVLLHAVNRLRYRQTTKGHHSIVASSKRQALMTLKKSRRGAELSENKTTPTSNKTTQTPSINPDLRTVISSMSSIQIRHSEQTMYSPHIQHTQPLPTVVESLTNSTTTLDVPHSHHPPVLQPYNAGRNGIGWVPERAVVECISLAPRAFRS